VLRLPDSKTGKKTVVLPAPALEILSGLPRASAYVLPATRGSGGGYYQGLGKLWLSIRERAGLPDVRLHDLRHSYASVAAAHGHSLLLIGALLGHRRAASSEIYAHLANDAVQAAAENTARRIAKAMQR